MIICFPLICSAQWTQNYILSVTPIDPTSSVVFSGVNAITDGRALKRIDYYDNLGNLESTCRVNYTPSGEALAQKIEYDDFGRQKKISLPTPANSQTSFSLQNANQYYGDSAYNEILYDNTLLDRIIGAKKSGSVYRAHPSTINYKSNRSNDVFHYFSYEGKLYLRGFYNTGELYMTENIDEDGKITSEYKNKSGQIVLIRQFDGNIKVNTYYVYDDFGQLCYVLPPLAADHITSGTYIADNNEFLKKYAYLYKYDNKGNCIEKRLPGCEPVYMEYNNKNQLVSLEDGNMRAKKCHQVMEYDKYGRLTSVGLSDSNNITWPLIVNYYDKYNFLNNLTANEQTEMSYQQKEGYDVCHTSATGRLTGCRIYALYGPGTYYIAKAFYYDSYGRIVQEHNGIAGLGGYEHKYYLYSFSGKVLKELHTQTNNFEEDEIKEVYTNTYDDADRLLMTKYKLGDNSEIQLIYNTYNELGQLVQKKSYNSNLFNTIYTYNIHGQNTTINGKYSKHYYYEQPASSNGIGCYNGNISESRIYSGATLISGDTYQYDGLNRLVSAIPYDGGNSYRTEWEYDKMSNITALQRYNDNGTLIDDLSISYIGNHIDEVSDDAGSQSSYTTKEYQDYSQELSQYGDELVGWDPQLGFTDVPDEHQYDANGNMTVDLDRKIVAIRYNLLNLPDTIQFCNGSQIVNRYLADGTKVLTEYHTVSTDAIIPIGTICQTNTLPGLAVTKKRFGSNVDYGVDSNGSTTLTRIYNPAGYYNGYGSSATAFYYERDIQGSITSVWDVNVNYPIQFTDYYADGLPKNNSWGTSFQPNLYIGKEYISMHGYDSYDFGARHTYTALGRFSTMDPLSEKYYSTSPYAYCAGNPVRYVDLDGNEIKTLFSNKYDDSFAKHYPDDNNAKILFAHGISNGKGIVDSRINNKNIVDSGQKLKEIVKSEFSEESVDKSNNTTILMSCDAANIKNGIAQDLSVAMPEETIIAPTDKVKQNGDQVKVLNDGDWVILKNGKEVDRYDGNWQPKSEPTQWDYFLYNKKDSFMEKLNTVFQDNK